MLLGVVNAIVAVATVISAVPRIRLVEAIVLCATAFAAGAGFATAIADRRRGQVR